MRRAQPTRPARAIIRVHIPPHVQPPPSSRAPDSSALKKAAILAGVGLVSAWIMSPSEPPIPALPPSERLDLLEALHAGSRPAPHQPAVDLSHVAKPLPPGTPSHVDDPPLEDADLSAEWSDQPA